jgi:hypothetical protein
MAQKLYVLFWHFFREPRAVSRAPFTTLTSSPLVSASICGPAVGLVTHRPPEGPPSFAPARATFFPGGSPVSARRTARA